MERTNKPQVLIFGGAFNPPTLAHQAIMRAGLELPDFKELWIMPSGDRLDKHISARDTDRLAMLELIKQNEFAGDKRLHISDFELHLPKPTQTYRTVGMLAVAYTTIDFWFIFGADSYQDMPSWDNGSELQSSLNMVIVERGESAIPKRQGLIPVHIKNYNSMSSTDARLAIANGMAADKFVCQSVKRYIEERKLYRSTEREML